MPKLNRSEREVFEYIRDRKEATAYEMGRRMNLPIQLINGCIGKLNDHVLIKEGGKRKNASSFKDNQLWLPFSNNEERKLEIDWRLESLRKYKGDLLGTHEAAIGRGKKLIEGELKEVNRKIEILNKL